MHVGLSNTGIKKQGIQINNSAAVIRAAISGQGIALARSAMAEEDIQSGRLIRLFPQISFYSPLAYYMVYRPELAHLPCLLAFKDWLLQEGKLCK